MASIYGQTEQIAGQDSTESPLPSQNFSNVHSAEERPQPNGYYTDGTNDDIAIIGFACELPGGITNADQFWDTICHGRSKSTGIPPDRWNVKGFHREGSNKLGVHKVGHAHFLERDVAVFDAPFFRITANEVLAMDPQQRMLLETTYRAFENAGLTLEDVSGSHSCVYMGTFGHDYSTILNRDLDRGTLYWVTGTGTAIIANRLSWFFNLKGPSSTVDTGCSASLLALHLACRSVLSGESHMEIAGGCNLLLDPDAMSVMSDNGFISPDGKSYSFDTRANGYGRGEGSGTVIIKRLSDAVRDGNTIRAVIRATGANHDGFTPGIAQPSSQAQENLIRDTYQQFNLSMSKTRLFEAHGTGTPVGDPIEAQAIQSAFAGSGISPEKPLIITALKPNIGHLESASGIASVIKVIISLEKGIVPPIAGLERLNPAIQVGPSILFARDSTEWPTKGLRRASINSFGYGGTNVHVVLDDAGHYLEERGLSDALHSTNMPQSHIHAGQNAPEGPKLLVFSAVDEKGIQRTAAPMEQFVVDHALAKSWPKTAVNMSYTLSEKRSHFPWRSYTILQSKMLQSGEMTKSLTKPLRSMKPPKLMFAFTGQGVQWASMGLSLMVYRTFRQSIEKSDECFQRFGSDWSLIEEMSRPQGRSRLDSPQLSQPISTALQMALVDLLRSWKVRPEAVIGHSSGEIAAAYCAGGLTKDSALKVAYFRGIIAEKTKKNIGNPVGMMMVAVSQVEAEQRVEELLTKSTTVSIACINSNKNITLSGFLHDLEALKSSFERDGIFTRVVNTGVPYHSTFMDPMSSVYEELILDLKGEDEKQYSTEPEFFSSTTASREHREHLASPSYWVQNLVQSVDFLGGFSRMLGEVPGRGVRKLGEKKSFASDPRASHVVEIGPHPALRTAISDIIWALSADTRVTYSRSLHREEDSILSILGTAGDLFARGYNIDLLSVNNLRHTSCKPRMLTDLPGYVFDHTSRYWLESRRSKEHRERQRGYHSLLGTRTTHYTGLDESRWTKYISLEDDQWVADHQISGVVIYPAAGFIVMALEAAKQLTEGQQASRFGFESVTIHKALVIPSDSSCIETEISLRGETRSEHLTKFGFSIRAFSGEWYECCRGTAIVEHQTMGHEVELWSAKDEALERERARHFGASKTLNNHISTNEVYRIFSESGLSYGPCFRSLSNVSCGGGEAAAQIDSLHWTKFATECETQSHTIHPSTIDGMLQLALVALSQGRQERALVPTKISRLWVDSQPTTSKSNGHIHHVLAKASKHGFRAAELELSALNFNQDNVTFECSFEATAPDSHPKEPQQQLDFCYSVDWKPDLNTMTPESIAQYCRPRRDFIDLKMEREQTSVSYGVLEQAIFHNFKNLTGSENYAGDRKHLHHYVRFMSDMVQNLGPSFRPCESLKNHLNDVERTNAPLTSALELAIRVAEGLSSVLLGEADPLTLLFSDDLLTRYYSDIINPALCQGLGKFADLQAHSNPSLRILEIGAGTGSATRPLLKTLAKNGDSSTYGSRFSYYCYTDISPMFFAKAQSGFAELGVAEQMDFKILDIEQDLADQGFVEGDFDLVLAANVVHATSNPQKTLSRISWLLKPGGKLVLFEITQPEPSRANFVFGLLPGWWLSSRDDGKHGPLLQTGDWDKQLKDAGFTGVDLDVQDDEDAFHHFTSLIVSTKPAETNNRLPAVVIASRKSELQQNVAGQLHLRAPDVYKVEFEDSAWDVPSSSLCIFAPELDQNITGELTQTVLGQLKHLSRTASTIIWLASSKGSDSNPFNGIAIGMLRVWRSENPQLQLVHLMVDTRGGAEPVVAKIQQVLTKIPMSALDSFEDEYREICGVLHINRVVPYTQLDRVIRPDRVPTSVQPEVFRGISESRRHTLLSISELGNLGSFNFVDNPRFKQRLGPSEVEIEVQASGLNFRDVFVALGRLEDDCFGWECAGIIRGKGAAITHLNVGDRVAHLGRATFATTCRCMATSVIKVPDSLSMADAAGLCLVTATALYALVHVARLSTGETILIHSGAGGLGQAAIQVALAHNAIVYTTVGSNKKKQFLMERFGIPGNHILSSRTLAFAATLKRLTGGRGVDIVLNSLSGEALQASLRCLASRGRFLETGKADIMSSAKLPMDIFINNISFMSIDLSHIILHEPVLLQSLLGEVMDLFRKEAVSVPTPVSIFPGSRLDDAFRLMRSGKHTGKIVIQFNDDDVVPTAPCQLSDSSKVTFDPHAAYILAGGLGGLGRSVSRWMVAQGARNLILLSRRTHHSSEVKNLIDDLKQMGATVATPSCDISNFDILKKTLEQYSHMGLIKGCLQLTMVVREGEFQDLSHSDIMESLHPKVDGSWNLHKLLPRDLDFFIMFASITGIIGIPGLSSYAMGNVFQDELARHRTSRGLKAFSIDLGLLSNVGYVAENAQLSLNRLIRAGFRGLTDADIKPLLNYFCDPGLPVASPESCQVIVGLDTLAATRSRGADGGPWFQRRLLRCTNQQRLVSDNTGITGGSSDTAVDVAATLRTAKSRSEAVTAVQKGLEDKLAVLLCIGDGSVNPDQPLTALGIDSLVGIEIKNWFRRSAGVDLAIFDILGDRSVTNLAELVVESSGFLKIDKGDRN